MDVGRISTDYAFRPLLPMPKKLSERRHLCFSCYSELERRLEAHRAVVFDQLAAERGGLKRGTPPAPPASHERETGSSTVGG